MLSKIASLLIEDYSKVALFSLRGDLMVYQGANYVKVWNFVADTGVTFNVGYEPYEQVILDDLSELACTHID
jgi:hypothetical protein